MALILNETGSFAEIWNEVALKTSFAVAMLNRPLIGSRSSSTHPDGLGQFFLNPIQAVFSDVIPAKSESIQTHRGRLCKCGKHVIQITLCTINRSYCLSTKVIKTHVLDEFACMCVSQSALFKTHFQRCAAQWPSAGTHGLEN